MRVLEPQTIPRDLCPERGRAQDSWMNVGEICFLFCLFVGKKFWILGLFSFFPSGAAFCCQTMANACMAPFRRSRDRPALCRLSIWHPENWIEVANSNSKLVLFIFSVSSFLLHLTFFILIVQTSCENPPRSSLFTRSCNELELPPILPVWLS